ncbi:ABC transporter ATP-binding protein [Sneathiella chinensis]|uniref:ABC transporter ATP-binding protein n=1 Tax=Sneathiella chinensis TaxID=349750 RepID=A0ABQ5U3A6_9PROT|nr:ABC transporter ATP-binding protein [Sneathiella chinensis]GLQ06645.1 ABC transporter ATP-binding protein [Sneathiella chinensis]
MSGLRLDGIVSAFEDGTRIGPVSMTVPEGRMVALLGPSGCGKTTSLRVVAGLAPVHLGRVTFRGQDMTNAPAARRSVGMVFQNAGLFPHMTVAENISFGLRMGKRPRQEIRDKLDWITEKTNLSGLEHRLPAQLSGGQKQRVALARSLVLDPDILLLDEPLSGLDANLRERMAGFIRDLQQDLAITTLFVTHDQEEALMLADEVAVMAAGRVLQQGTPQAVYSRPACLEVATFMGGTNFLSVTGCRDGAFETEIGRIAGPVSTSAAGGVSHLMIRPENIGIEPAGEAPGNAKDGGGAALNVWPAKIISVRYHGGLETILLEVAGRQLVARQKAGQLPAASAAVRIVLSPDHICPLNDEIPGEKV